VLSNGLTDPKGMEREIQLEMEQGPSPNLLLSPCSLMVSKFWWTPRSPRIPKSERSGSPQSHYAAIPSLESRIGRGQTPRNPLNLLARLTVCGGMGLWRWILRGGCRCRLHRLLHRGWGSFSYRDNMHALGTSYTWLV